MASTEIKIDGLNDLLSNISDFNNSTEAAIEAAMAVVSDDVAKTAQQNHTFQNQTGNLEASIGALPVEKDGNEIIGVVQAGMEYAYWVEFGTSKMAPRPFLTAAVESNKSNLLNTISAAVERAKQVVKVTT